MVTVQKHVPIPIPQPPITYDILGLTLEQFEFLRDILYFTAQNENAAIFTAIAREIGSVGWDSERRGARAAAKRFKDVGIDVAHL